MLVARIGSNYQKSQSWYTKKDNNTKNDQPTFTHRLQAVKKASGHVFGILMMLSVVTAGLWGFAKSDEADMKNPKKARKMLTELKSEYAKNDSALKAQGVTYIMSEKIKPTLIDTLKAFRVNVYRQKKLLGKGF